MLVASDITTFPCFVASIIVDTIGTERQWIAQIVAGQRKMMSFKRSCKHV